MIYLDFGVKYDPDLFLTGEIGPIRPAQLLVCHVIRVFPDLESSQWEFNPVHLRSVAPSPCAAVICHLM